MTLRVAHIGYCLRAPLALKGTGETMSAQTASTPAKTGEFQDGYVQVSLESRYSSLHKTSLYLGSAGVLLIIAAIGMCIYAFFGEGGTGTIQVISIGALVVTLIATIVLFVMSRREFSAHKDELAAEGIH